MEFQTLKKDNRKYWVIGIVVILAIVATIAFVETRAKYRNTQSIQVAKGTINYSSADFTIVSMTDQDGNELTIMPSSGYIIDEEKSYCTVSGEKDYNAVLKTIDGNHTFANLQKGSKCYLVFNEVKILASDTILANNTVATRTDFSSVYTDNTAGKIFSAEDDDGTTYYFAGSSPNNWVKFGGFYWRIIRINGDGTIRLIYNGTSTTTTGAGTQISTSAYNSSYDNNMYVGYMYTNGEVHGTGTDSTIKGVLDTWYNNNLKTSYASYIDTNAGFCNDRYPSTSSSSSNGSGGTGTTTTYYAPHIRLYTNKQPSYKCQTSSDSFTVGGASKGNKSLKNPIGLITMDEAYYAGVYNSSSTTLWLYTNQSYWTMSPADYPSPEVFFVDSDGWFRFTGGVVEEYGVRPVINLRSDTQITGTGTSSNPYIVQKS